MEYRHYHFARGLIERGHRVVVISGSRSHLFIRPPQVSRPFTLEPIDGVTYCWVAVPRYERAISLRRVLNMAAFALRLERLPVQRLPRPDAILVSSPSLFPVPIAARWAQRFGARLVFEVCDIWPLTLRELGGLSRGHPLVMAMQWLEDYGYRKADSVVSVLPAATRHMVSRGMDPRKFHYIPNGIDLAGRRAGGRAPDVVRAAIRPGTFTVGFVGTLGRANALETLIDAARLLDPDEAQVILVGQGPEREQLVTRAAGAPNVAFTAAVLEEHVGPAIALFDACYVGYRRSPLYRFGVSPNKLYEYMAAGRPVLFAADAANQPVQEADCGRTVAPEDPAALAAAIRSLAARSQEERVWSSARLRRCFARSRLVGAARRMFCRRRRAAACDKGSPSRQRPAVSGARLRVTTSGAGSSKEPARAPFGERCTGLPLRVDHGTGEAVLRRALDGKTARPHPRSVLIALSRHGEDRAFVPEATAGGRAW
jgi:glycosyltransferase involved in cell wall biosynthesis